ncbi:MAG TPA: ElyC/SanA/YdcF family protein [Opitutales bacterium]|jgi:vancomycin permeability regulator SanA|nr:ElyC/SanA/YdcF family protein [Opitutales bacterium]
MSVQLVGKARPFKRLIRRGLFVLVTLVVLGFLTVFGLNWWLISSATGKIYTRVTDVSAAPVALVLGAGPGSLFFNYRLDAAAELYKAGKVSHLLVSGNGAALDPMGSETALMQQGLLHRGVPASAITRDDFGFRTLDSMARAHSVFRLKSIIIVSQEFHLPRALYLAHAWGLDAVGFAATSADVDFYDSHFREWFARVKAVADEEVLNTQPQKLGPSTPIMLEAPPIPAAAK